MSITNKYSYSYKKEFNSDDRISFIERDVNKKNMKDNIKRNVIII